MFSLVIFLFVLGILIIVHEFGHFIVAKKTGVRVEKFALGFGPQLVSRKKGDTHYSINALPLGGYVNMAGFYLEEYKGKKDEYLSQPPGKRFWIISSGSFLNYILGFLCFWFIFFCGYPTLTTKVGGLLDGFGAKDAGIQVGDKIIAVDGQKVEYWEDLQKVIQEKKEATTVRLSLLRNNQERTLNVRIRQKQLDDQLGQKHSVGLLGVTPYYDEFVKVRHGFWESFLLGLDKTRGLTVITYKALWRMLTGKLSIKESVAGPLGIFLITSNVARQGAIALLNFIAVLSISLGIFNLLPLPVLDGGHIVLLAIEKIRGKYLGLKTERIINQVGISLIITLALLVTYNDLSRLFGDKISKLFTK